jgi:DNA-binding response OmpR family regulator
MIKIAIIEDDLAIVQMYRLKFEAEGYEVRTAGNGQIGLGLINDFDPDIILLDLMMPVMPGDKMLAQLRTMPNGKDKKVIVLTNMGKEEVPKDVYDNGALEVIIKAEMTPRQVAEVVRKTLEG